METIHFNKGEHFNVNYPVGTNMKNAMELAKCYAIHLAEDIQSKDYNPYIGLNIWVRGSSGAILGALTASILQNSFAHAKVVICHIKKPNEYSHYDGTDESSLGLNIILDDFMSTGETVKAIYKAVCSKMSNPTIHYLCVSRGDVENLGFAPNTLIIE